MITPNKITDLMKAKDLDEVRSVVDKMSEQDAKMVLVALVTAWNKQRFEDLKDCGMIVEDETHE